MIGPRAVPTGGARYDESSRAEVAEQADATVSNTVEGNLVRVQVPASAPQAVSFDAAAMGRFATEAGVTVALVRPYEETVER